MRLDLRALRSFVTVASAGSISSAAHSLHIAQPALSVQIKQLEEQLGAALFDRHPRGVVLTAVGERLLGHAVEILRRVDVAYDDVRQAVDQPSGRVAIALPQSVAKFVTVPLVQAVVRQWPQIHLQMVEMSSGYIPQQLLHGLVDIGMTFGTEDDARMRFMHVLQEELAFVTTAQQLARHRGGPDDDATHMTLHDAARFPMVLPTTTQSLRRVLDAYMAKAGVAPRIVVEVNTIHEILALVAAGIGSTILSFAAVHDMLAARQLLALPVGRPAMSRSIYACRSATLPMSIAATKVHEQLLATIVSLSSSQRWPRSTVIAALSQGDGRVAPSG
ncbi:LysR family transcriptional regulator [Alicycliphilus denitrificans]|uniref:LysR family transcriptional regulator n=1 Tax=Alicycliphilus denitrificans TaxID=179636 RepID=A0A858ZR36_9BURK|nr:LysR family transcriptional regulator [Alicycliphilus denitrificans]ADU99060.1 LysR substrate-binding protein [Alicycliphilus denitrificans BC]QKD43360.1 LysR family transcriptional regulator [Alicycliphilus denitrificans]GAO27196.1 LysR family transcriptional regulator [Alicycliphilus sp. B1]